MMSRNDAGQLLELKALSIELRRHHGGNVEILSDQIAFLLGFYVAVDHDEQENDESDDNQAKDRTNGD